MIKIQIKTTNGIFQENEYVKTFEMPRTIEKEKEILSFISEITLPQIKEVIIKNDELNNEYYEI